MITQSLTQGLAKGDEAAFREFHARYFDRLYQFLLVVARGREDEAQEALQQTLLRVARYARVFDSEEAFWSWLKVLGRCAARDAGRKAQRYARLLQGFSDRHKQQLPGNDELERLRGLLSESLADLEPADGRLLQAKYLDGDSVREISIQTGLTEKAVESRLVRLRQQLRAVILNKLRTS